MAEFAAILNCDPSDVADVLRMHAYFGIRVHGYYNDGCPCPYQSQSRVERMGEAKECFERAYAHGEVGEYPEAIADYTRAIELDPKEPAAYNNRGIAYAQTGGKQYYNAMADYARAIALDPQFADPFYNRGALHEINNDMAEAMRDYARAIKLAPEYSAPILALGEIYQKIIEAEDFIRRCKAANDSPPEPPAQPSAKETESAAPPRIDDRAVDELIRNYYKPTGTPEPPAGGCGEAAVLIFGSDAPDFAANRPDFAKSSPDFAMNRPDFAENRRGFAGFYSVSQYSQYSQNSQQSSHRHRSIAGSSGNTGNTGSTGSYSRRALSPETSDFPHPTKH